MAVLLLLALALAAWWRAQPDVPSTDAPATASAPTPEAAAPATADVGAASAGRSDVALDPTAPVFTVRGRVLGDRRASLAGAEVVAREGSAGDRGGFLTMMSTAANGRRPDANPFLADGAVLARAKVAADGTFTLQTQRPHLRLGLEHDLYGLALPEIVHVSSDARTIDVVLAPFLGGCVRGRLFGPDPARIRGIRLSTRPDPMGVIRDPQLFLGAIARAVTPAVEPAADGAFVFRAIAAGNPFTLLATGDTAAGRASQPALEPGEVRDVALPITASVDLAVRVVDAAGTPIADARVSATADDEGGADAMTRELAAVRAKTAADGTATLRGLAPGAVRVRAAAPGHLPATAAAIVPDERRVELTLPRGASVRGVVVGPAAQPLAGARVGSMPAMEVPMLGDMAAQIGLDVLATATEGGVVTDAEGRFELSGLEDGSHNVVAALPGYAPGVARKVQPGDDAVRIELQPALSIAARVVAAEDGTPLSTFTLELRASMFALLERPVRTETFAGTADGTAQLGDLPPGDFTLAASAEGRAEATVSVHLPAEAALELRLSRAASVRGRVQDANGVGIPGALVQRSRGGVRDNPLFAMLLSTAETVRCDDNGAFRLDGLSPGRLQLAASATGFAGGKSARLDLAAGATIDDVAIVLDHGGSIDGVLKTVRGEAPDEFTVLVQSEATQKTTTVTVAPDGRFRATDLDPGRYQVQAMHPAALRLMRGAEAVEPGRVFDIKSMIERVSESTVSQRCSVQAGQTTAVELDASDLGSGTRLSLRVTIGGQPLLDGIVEAMLVDDGRLRIGFLGDGEATFAALRPGRVRVQVRTGLSLAPVGAPQFVDVPIGIDRHRATIELPGGELGGRVLDPGGQPLSSVQVRLLRHGSGTEDDLFGTAITDDDGGFTFRGLQPDTYGLVAVDAMLQRSAAGAASRVDSIRIADGERRTGIELRAAPAVGVSVTAVDASGAPIAGAMLLAVDADGHPLGNFALAVTGQDGKAHLGGLPPGAVRIAGRASGYAPDVSTPIEAIAGQQVELTLRLPRGTRIVLDARAADGTPLAGASIAARRDRGPWIPALLLLENNGAGGRFELGRLQPGSWEFRVEHPATGSFLLSRAIGEGAAVTILATPPR